MARDILGELGLAAPVEQSSVPPQGEPKDIMTELGYKAKMPMPQGGAAPRDVIAELGLDKAPSPAPVSEGPGVTGHVKSGANALVQGLATLPSGALDFLANTSSSVAGRDVTQNLMYQAARGLDEGVGKTFPTDPRVPEFETAVIKGLGQIGGQVGAMVATGGASLPAQAARGLASLGIPGMNVGEAMRDASQSGASPEEIKSAGAFAGGLSGATEFLPVGKVLSILDKGAPGLKQKLINTATTGALEGSQEALQQLIINSYAKLNYDERRELVQGLGESAAVGGTVGAIAGLIASAVGGKRIKYQSPEAAKEEKQLQKEADASLAAEEKAEQVVRTETSDVKMEAFFKAAEEFKGFENIPDGHPAIAGLKASEQLKFVNAYEKAQRGEKQSKETKEPGKKLTFKEKLAEDIKKFKSLQEVETFYSGKKHQKLAMKLWETKDLPPEPVVPKETLNESITPPMDVLRGDVLPGDEQVNQEVQKASVEVAPAEEVATLDQNPAVVEPELTEEMKAQLKEEILGEEASVPAPVEDPLKPEGIGAISNSSWGSIASELKKKPAGNKATVEDVTLRSKIIHSEDVPVVEAIVEQPSPELTTPEGAKIFESLELAEEDYRLLPRNYTSHEQAAKALETKGEGFEILKVGETYKLGKDWFSDDAPEIDMARLEKALEEIDKPIVEAPVPKAQKEVIKVEEFTKMGDNWVGQVGDGRAVAIIKSGAKAYDAYLGSPTEIQSGTAELVESFGSLPKAKAAFKSEGKEVKKVKKLSAHELAEAIRAKRQMVVELADEAREAELARLIQEQEADMLGEENIESWEELAEKESMQDYDEDGYFDQRDLKDSLDDLVTLFGDERGSITIRNASTAELSPLRGKTLTVYRGTGRNANAPTEGHGLYVALDYATAEGFGTVKEIEITIPENTLVGDSTPILSEENTIFEPITDQDSTWMRIHKQTAKELKFNETNFNEEVFVKKLTENFLNNGYDAVQLGDQNFGWVVILDQKYRTRTKDKNQEIIKAKRRLAQDIRHLTKSVKGMKDKLGRGKYEPLEEVIEAAENVREANSVWRTIRDYTSKERGEQGSVNFHGFTQLLSELGIKIKRAYESVKNAAKAVKTYLTSKKYTNPYGRYAPKDQTFLQRTVLHTIDQSVKALKTDSHLANLEMFNYMKSQKRIVPDHDGQSFTPPERQRPMIRVENIPQLKPGITTLAPHVMGKWQSPSNIFKQIFEPEHNPIIDYMESTMAHFFNEKNDGRFVKTILKEFKDDSAAIRQEFDKLYEPLKALVRSKQVGDKKINTWTNTTSVTQDFKVKRELKAKIDLEKKKQTVRAKKIQEQLTQTYDNAIGDLARKYPTVRIGLQAGQVLPQGIQLSPAELKAAEAMREYFDQSALDLKRVGVPIIQEEGRTYMHRILPEILNDPDSQSFLSDQKIPTVMRFMHQSVDGRLWYPDAHTIFSNYVPVANRKIAFQPFLNRWRQTMDEVPQDISEYFTDWLGKNLLSQPRTKTHKIIDGVIAFEYMRLIGGSLSVAFKHATKAADSLARYDMVTNTKALNSTAKAITQFAMKSLGAQGEFAELGVWQAYVRSRAMVRMLDETPGMNSLAYNFKAVLGSPTSMVEAVDNGVTIFSTILAAKSDGKFTQEEASRIVWETVMAANFRGGADQPLFYKNVLGRTVGMFQSTPWKLLEYRADIIRGAIRGEVDHFGTSYGSILTRYLMLMGMAEGIARAFGNSLLDLWLHFPYVSHFVKPTKDAPYIAPAIPTAAGSPVAEWITQMKNKDIYHGTTEHLIYWGLPSRIYAMNTQDYPTDYYNSPLSHLFGIKREDVPSHGPLRAKGNSSSRSGRSGRPTR